jgi:hypothetical protein
MDVVVVVVVLCLLTCKPIRSTIMQHSIPTLGIHSRFEDVFGLAGVFLRELGGRAGEVCGIVDAGEVEDVVDFVGCESRRRHCCMCVWGGWA